MDVYISLGNSKNDLRAIADPAKKSFIQHLVKLFNPKLSEHSKMLRESSGNLAKLDRQSTQKQSFLTQAIPRFHYVQKSLFAFDKQIYTKKIFQDSFDALSKYVQYNFADKIAAEIAGKTMQFFELTEPAVQEADQKHLVLGTAGTLLEVDYNILYVQFDEGTKWKFWRSFSKEPLNKRNKKNQIHFVAILFAISIIHNPLKEEEVTILKQNVQLTFTKKQLDFIETKQKLMKFVDEKMSNNLFLAFDKFQLLQFENFKVYWKKYLNQYALKVGYFDSMRQYINGPNSIFTNAIKQSNSLASDPLQIYNYIVQPVIKILTPINSPMLPDFLKQIARSITQSQKKMLRQAQVFKQVTDFGNLFLTQSQKEFDSKQKTLIEERIEQLYNNFYLQVLKQEKDANNQLQGVRLYQLIESLQSRVGQVEVRKRIQDKVYRIQHYTGILYDQQTVISNFDLQDVSSSLSVKFFLKENKPFQIDIYNNQTTGKILKLISKIAIQTSQYNFSLDFMQDYSSQFCLHESLVNRNIYMAGIMQDIKGNIHQNLELQVSKIIGSFRYQFFQLFKKKPGFQGAPIFYVDETKKMCKIIAFCQNQNSFNSLFQKRNVEIKENSAQNYKNLLEFSTKFLQKEVYAQLVAKKQPIYDEKKIQILDKNDKGEPLREQLLNKSIQGSSPIELIGIFKMVMQQRVKYGIAILCTNNYFIASASNVLFEGSGYIHLRKSFTQDQQQNENFQGFDLVECCLYEHLEIQRIIKIPDNQEYVYLEVKRSEIQKLKTERKINRNSVECLLDSREMGGFFMEFDFSHISHTDTVHSNFYHIDNDFLTVLAKTEKEYPEKQGIIFAYEKNNPKIQYFLGLYSPKSPFGCFSLPETGQQSIIMEEKLVIAVQQDGDIIELQKMKEVVEKQQYQAIGYFKYRSDPLGFGTGTLISTDNKSRHSKVNKILTCAHNFYSISDEGLADDTDNLQEITFCYYNKHLFKFCELPLKKVIIHPTYKEIIDRRMKEPSSEDPLLQIQSAYDIAIVFLEERVCLQSPFRLELPFTLTVQLIDQLQTFKKNQILVKRLIKQVEVAGFPQDLQQLSIVHGKMYKQNVLSHEGETISEDPLFYFNIVPLSSSLEESLVIKHKLSTLPGQSGSPIFNKSTKTIVGVHVAALNDQRIWDNSLVTFQNIGSFVYNPSIYKFLKDND